VWWPVFPTPSENYSVVAPDLPGLGKSEALHGRLSAARVVDWLEDVIGECCDGPVVLVATSMGGAFGLRFAVSHPEMLQRLILTDAQGLAPFRPPLGFFIAANLNTLRPSQRTMRRLTRYVIHDQEHVRRLHGAAFDSFLAYMISRGGRAEVRQAMLRHQGQFAAHPRDCACRARSSRGVDMGSTRPALPPLERDRCQLPIRLAAEGDRRCRPSPLRRTALRLHRSSELTAAR
jgi:pimeloyl-ACP methyl ester carboxylesterase